MTHFPFVLAVLILTTANLHASDREFVYNQKKGRLTFNGKTIGIGYSGKGAAKNDPTKENKRNIGPIPRGSYTISKPFVWQGAPYVFRLKPIGHNARGRTGLLIHGDSRKTPGDASHGCVILNKNVRRKIVESGVKKFRVVRD